MFRKLVPLALAYCLALGHLPANADEVMENLDAAKKAYQAGNVQETKEILDYVSVLLGQSRNKTLASFLPAAQAGWRRKIADTSKNAAAMAMMGGGAVVEATYRGPAGEHVKVQIMADTPLVGMFAMQLRNPAIMAQMGKVKRIKGQKVLIAKNGEVKTMVANRFVIMIDGKAPVETKLAYYRGINMDGLKKY